ncbi:MAG: C39 family peptidase [Candidatus Komeilibacteria bacterium]|nr:C39 family peptidase [Candidatus Komeilibacteria bacterium]
MKKIILSLGGLAVIALIIGYSQRQNLKNWYYQANQPKLPASQNFDNFVNVPALPSSTFNPQTSASYSPSLILPKAATSAIQLKLTNQKTSLPDQINLNIPFASQAPFANWDLPYQETCEEAASLMVHYYFAKKSFTGPGQINDELLKMIDWETKFFGDYKDTTAAQTAELLKKYFNYSTVQLITNPTIDQIKNYLKKGLPVLAPTYGKDLPNPNFRAGGPLYHMLVIKGYTPTTFITNDPGTRKGADFQYLYQDLLNALHDWNNGDVVNGQKVVIIIQPN